MPCMMQLRLRAALGSTLRGHAISSAVLATQAHIVSASRECTVWSRAACFLWALIKKASTPKAKHRKACADTTCLEHMSAGALQRQPPGKLPVEAS